MKKALAYFFKVHEKIKTSYTEHCGVVAEKVAYLMLKEDNEPYIMMVYEEIRFPSGEVKVTSMTPLRYEGTVKP